MSAACMLTTFDNPYDPFDQFDEWFLFDVEKGYNSCEYLSRIAKTSDSLSSIENDKEIERAIDEIIEYDFMNIYKKVYEKTDDLNDLSEFKNSNDLKDLKKLQKLIKLKNSKEQLKTS